MQIHTKSCYEFWFPENGTFYFDNQGHQRVKCVCVCIIGDIARVSI